MLAKGAGLVFLGAVFGNLVTYGYNAFVARTLGVTYFGMYSLGLYMFNIATLFALAGIHTGVLRHVALYNGSGSDRKTKGIVFSGCWVMFPISILGAALLFFMSDFMAVRFFNEPRLGQVFKIFAVGVPFFNLSTVYMFATQGLKVMRYRVYIRNFFDPLSKLILTIVFFSLGWQLVGVLIAFVATTIVGAFLFWRSLARLFPFDNQQVKPRYGFKELILFSLPLMPVGVFQALSMRMEPLLLGSLSSSSEVGLYSAAYQTSMLTSMILIALNTIFSPMISDLYNKSEIGRLEELFGVVARWNVKLCMPLLIIMVLFAGDILSIFGPEFVEGRTCLIILALGQLVHTACGPVGFVLTMAGRTVLVLVNTVGILLFRVILNLFLIPRMALAGAALSSSISIVLLNIVMIIEMWRLVGMQPFEWGFLKPVICGIGAMLITCLLISLAGTYGNMVVGVIVVLVSYGALLLIFGLNREDRMILDKVRKRLRGKQHV